MTPYLNLDKKKNLRNLYKVEILRPKTNLFLEIKARKQNLGHRRRIKMIKVNSVLAVNGYKISFQVSIWDQGWTNQ